MLVYRKSLVRIELFSYVKNLPCSKKFVSGKQPTHPSAREKCWLKGGVEGQFPRNLNWTEICIAADHVSENRRSIRVI